MVSGRFYFYSRLVTKFVWRILTLAVIYYAVGAAKKGKRRRELALTVASRDEEFPADRPLKLEPMGCSPQNVSSLYVPYSDGCSPTFCSRLVVDGFLSKAEAGGLRKLVDFALSVGGADGGAEIVDLHSGAVSKGSRFIDLYVQGAWAWDTPAVHSPWHRKRLPLDARPALPHARTLPAMRLPQYLTQIPSAGQLRASS